MKPLIYKKADYAGYAIAFGYLAVLILVGNLIKV